MVKFLLFLKILLVAALFGLGGWMAMEPRSLFHEIGGIALGVLATWLLTALFPRWVPSKILSSRLLESPAPEREMGEIKRFFLALAVLALVVLQDRLLHQEKWLYFIPALGLLVFFLFFLEKKSLSFSTEDRGTGDPLKWDWRHVAIIMLVGAVFLFYRLPTWPNWLANDGQADLRTAVSVCQGSFYRLFCTEAGDNPTLAFLLFGIGMKLFGISVFSAALITAIVNWLVLPLYYGFARILVPPSAAFLAGVLLASSHWTCFFIRTPREVSIVPAVTILALYCFAKALQTGRRRDYAWLGIAMVLCLHVYLPGKAVLLFILASVYFLALFKTKNFYHTRHLWLLAGTVFVVWMIPLGVWYYHYFGTLVDRSRELSVFSLEWDKTVLHLRNNLTAALLMFSVRGNGEPHFNLPGMQMLDPLAGAALWVGLAWCVGRIRRFPAFLLVLGFCVTLSTILFSRGEAHPMRSIVNAPFCYLLAAIGADRIMRTAGALFRGRGVLLRRCLAAVFLAFAAGWNYHVYFNLTPKNREVFEYGEGRNLLLENVLLKYPEGWDWYQIAPNCYSSHCFLFGEEWGFPYGSLPLKRVPKVGAVIALQAGLGWTLREEIAHCYPLARHEVLWTPFGEAAFETWEIKKDEIQKALEREPPPAPVKVRFYSQEGRRLGSRAIPAIREMWYFLDGPPAGTASFVLETNLQVEKKTDLFLEGYGSFSVSVNGLPVTQASSALHHRAAFQVEPGASRLKVSFVPHDKRVYLSHMNLDEFKEGKWEPLPLKAYRQPKDFSD